MVNQLLIGGKEASEAITTGFLDGYGVFDTSANLEYEEFYTTILHFLLPTQGTLSARLEVSLPKNAVVDALELKVTARRAQEAVAGEVAELRGTAGTGADQHQIIVDFGTVRTVSAAKFNLSSRIQLVEAWNGTEFPRLTTEAPFTAPLGPFQPGSEPDLKFALFRSEVRTERLRITVTSTQSVGALLDDLRLILPDSPKDLTIAIDGGPPVWNLLGPAAKGPDAALSADSWNDKNERLVVLTEAFRELTGDPLTEDEQTFEVTLTSREAGVLEIALHRADVRRIRRVRFGSATSETLTLEAEGVSELPLAVPGAPVDARAKALSLLVSGAFGPERRLPATGPEPVFVSSSEGPSTPLVELDMTSEQAVILRLAAVDELPALTGLRLPLLAGAAGAEVRIEPWSNADPALTQPGAALSELIGAPVTLEANSAADPAWLSYAFAGPLEIDPANPPWVAILVTRGKVSVRLSAGTGESGTIRVGPPSGPWRRLPGLFGTAEFAGLRFPHRVIGEALDPLNPAPVHLALAESGAAPIETDPVEAGAPARLDGLDVVAPKLLVTHFGAGELGLSDIDIVFDK